MIEVNQKGSFKNLESFLRKMAKRDLFNQLDSLAQEGVRALSEATPIESGLTAGSWGYEIEINSKTSTITWINTNVINGFPLAVALQYGHGTGSGGFVHGRDYINPALKPIFDKIADKVWEAVTSA